MDAVKGSLGNPRSSSDIRPWDGIDFSGDPGKCDPSFKKECDVNHLMKDYEKKGFSLTDAAEAYYMRKGTVKRGVFADVADSVMFTDALKIVADGESAFLSLDASVRQYFDHDPAKFLAFFEDINNVDKMVELGLATKQEVHDVLAARGIYRDPNEAAAKAPRSGDSGDVNGGAGKAPSEPVGGGSTSSST